MPKKTIILFLIFFTSTNVWSSTEEALILNQELKFLEDYANHVTIIGETENSTISIPNNQAVEENLESKYFGNEVKDSIRTKVSAPSKRRSL